MGSKSCLRNGYGLRGGGNGFNSLFGCNSSYRRGSEYV